MEWSARQFRASYHFNRFTSGWRKLVVFYVAMWVLRGAKWEGGGREGTVRVWQATAAALPQQQMPGAFWCVCKLPQSAHLPCCCCRTLAGYAQVIHAFIFYAAWGSLVLMYWEVRSRGPRRGQQVPAEKCCAASVYGFASSHTNSG